eukprot:751690-Hanusia_phi.AAC.1
MLSGSNQAAFSPQFQVSSEPRELSSMLPAATAAAVTGGVEPGPGAGPGRAGPAAESPALHPGPGGPFKSAVSSHVQRTYGR